MIAGPPPKLSSDTNSACNNITLTLTYHTFAEIYYLINCQGSRFVYRRTRVIIRTQIFFPLFALAPLCNLILQVPQKSNQVIKVGFLYAVFQSASMRLVKLIISHKVYKSPLSISALARFVRTKHFFTLVSRI